MQSTIITAYSGHKMLTVIVLFYSDLFSGHSTTFNITINGYKYNGCSLMNRNVFIGKYLRFKRNGKW